jgi:hypothetical protein
MIKNNFKSPEHAAIMLSDLTGCPLDDAITVIDVVGLTCVDGVNASINLNWNDELTVFMGVVSTLLGVNHG